MSASRKALLPLSSRSIASITLGVIERHRKILSSSPSTLNQKLRVRSEQRTSFRAAARKDRSENRLELGSGEEVQIRLSCGSMAANRSFPSYDLSHESLSRMGVIRINERGNTPERLVRI